MLLDDRIIEDLLPSPRSEIAFRSANFSSTPHFASQDEKNYFEAVGCGSLRPANKSFFGASIMNSKKVYPLAYLCVYPLRRVSYSHLQVIAPYRY